jgi:ribosome modulation factor
MGRVEATVDKDLHELAKSAAEDEQYGRAHGSAFCKGYVAFAKGASESTCPYGSRLIQTRGFRNAWISGYRYAMYDDALVGGELQHD